MLRFLFVLDFYCSAPTSPRLTLVIDRSRDRRMCFLRWIDFFFRIVSSCTLWIIVRNGFTTLQKYNQFKKNGFLSCGNNESVILGWKRKVPEWNFCKKHALNPSLSLAYCFTQQVANRTRYALCRALECARISLNCTQCFHWLKTRLREYLHKIMKNCEHLFSYADDTCGIAVVRKDS